MSARPKRTEPLRPAARYRRGQATAQQSDSDSSDAEQQQEPVHEQEDDPHDQADSITKSKSRIMALQLNQVEIDQHGSVRVGGKDEVGRTEREREEEEEEEEESEEEVKPSMTSRQSRQGVPASDEVGFILPSTLSLLPPPGVSPQTSITWLT